MAYSTRIRWVWLSLAVVAADRATKAVIEIFTPEGYRRSVINNLIYIVHARNPGIAFGIFSDSRSKWLTLSLILGSLAVMGVLSWMLIAGPAGARLSQAGLALILGGATGNLTDRLLHGAVTDFFEVLLGPYHWPAFNVADSAITIGAILVALDLLIGTRQMAGEPGSKEI
jgi:signal peptidase II